MQNFGSSDDMASIGRAIVEAINEVRSAIAELNVTLGSVSLTGAFVTVAGANQVIPNPNVQDGSVILLMPTTAAAAVVQAGAGMIFNDRAANVPGVSFTIARADGSALTAGQNFRYVIVNPVS